MKKIYLLTQGAEPFLRSRQLRSHSRTSQDEKDISTFLKITGIMNNIFKPNKVRKKYKNKIILHSGPSSAIIRQ
jgi:hypothetical protein